MAEKEQQSQTGTGTDETARTPQERAPTPQEREGEEEMASTDKDPLLRERWQMYEGFLKLTAFTVVVVVVILILMAIFLL